MVAAVNQTCAAMMTQKLITKQAERNVNMMGIPDVTQKERYVPYTSSAFLHNFLVRPQYIEMETRQRPGQNNSHLESFCTRYGMNHMRMTRSRPVKMLLHQENSNMLKSADMYLN